VLTGIVISQGLAALKINSFFRLLSCLRAAAESEKRGDFCLAHAIEVSGHFDLTFEEAEPLRFLPAHRAPRP
jgi:hypothetical protein